MKAYIEQLLRDNSDPIAGRNVLREYLQARILERLQRSGAMLPLAFHGGTAPRFYMRSLDFLNISPSLWKNLKLVMIFEPTCKLFRMNSRKKVIRSGLS